MSPYTVAWIAWGLGFVAIESAALFDKDEGDTLSEHVRKWAGVKGGGSGAWAKVRRVGLLAFLAWLSVHLLTDGFV